MKHKLKIRVFTDRVKSTVTETEENRTQFVTEPNRTKYSVIGLDMGLAMKPKTEQKTKFI